MKKSYIIVFFTVLVVNFFLPRLMPGDPFLFLSVEDGDISSTIPEKQIEYYHSYYGIDRPIAVQFFEYIKNVFTLNLGNSIYYNQKVSKLILNRVAWTFFIVVSSLFFGSIIGTTIGMFSAWKRNDNFDKITYTVMSVISEIPSFVIGIVLLFILAGKYKLFPLAGGKSPFQSPGLSFENFVDILRHAFLPVLTLVIANVGDFYNISRSSMISVLSKEYITTARAKGLGNRIVLFKHALKNAIIPIITRVFMSLAKMFGGAVLVENVFSYPGLGKLMQEAVVVRDYILLQGIFVVIVVLVMMMNGLAEVAYRRIDPRVRRNEG